MPFRAAFQGKGYAQPVLWRDPGSSAGELITRRLPAQ
jgi:hypothetical protein